MLTYMDPDKPPINSLQKSGDAKEKVQAKKEGFPIITQAEFDEIFIMDTGRDGFADFVGFVEKDKGTKPTPASVYVNHTIYEELGPEIKNFSLTLTGLNSGGLPGPTPLSFDSYTLKIGDRPFQKELGPNKQEKQEGLRKNLEGKNEVEVLRYALENIQRMLGSEIILATFRINPRAPDTTKATAREVLKVLMEKFILEVLARRIQDRAGLKAFAKEFFSDSDNDAKMKEAQIEKIEFTPTVIKFG